MTSTQCRSAEGNFMLKLWKLVLTEPEYTDRISWTQDGEYLLVHDQDLLMETVKALEIGDHKCYDSFGRQLRNYGWRRVIGSKRLAKPFAHMPSDTHVWYHCQEITRNSSWADVARLKPPPKKKASRAANPDAYAKETKNTKGHRRRQQPQQLSGTSPASDANVHQGVDSLSNLHPMQSPATPYVPVQGCTLPLLPPMPEPEVYAGFAYRSQSVNAAGYPSVAGKKLPVEALACLEHSNDSHGEEVEGESDASLPETLNSDIPVTLPHHDPCNVTSALWACDYIDGWYTASEASSSAGIAHYYNSMDGDSFDGVVASTSKSEGEVFNSLSELDEETESEASQI